MNEKEYWESFTDSDSIKKAIWADSDKVKECLDMIVPAIRDKLHPGARVFDLGCGTGRLLYPLAAKYPDVSFTGIDFSKVALKYADKRKNIKYVQNDGRSIPFDSGYFDAGYSMILFQHIPNENFAAYLKQVAMVLKKGGVFRFQFVEGGEQAFLSHHAHFYEAMAWIKEAGLKYISSNKGIYDVWTWVTVSKL